MYLFRTGVPAVLLLVAAGLVASAQPPRDTDAPRGFLGILLGPAEQGAQGVLVRDVTPDSPAAKAGLKRGDRIVKLDDEDVRDVEKFLRTLAGKKPGDKLNLGIVRDGKEQSVAATVGERPAREAPAVPDAPGSRRPAFLGVQTQQLTPELKQRLNVEADAGVVVTEVVPSSPAATAGLKRDDVITAVNDQAVRSAADLRDAVQKAGPGKDVTLQVARGKEKQSLKATLREGNFGFFLTPGDDRFPTVDVESMFDQSRRIRELEQRVEELEKRLRERNKK